MPTARVRMLELSPLASGATARDHLLAITQTGGGELRIVEGEFVTNIITQESISDIMETEILATENMTSSVSSDMTEVVTKLIRTDING